MKWFNVGLLAVSLGVLLAPPHLLTAPAKLFQSSTHEVDIDRVSLLAIEVLSNEMILLQIRVEPDRRPNALWSTQGQEKTQTMIFKYRQQIDRMN